jgi:tRNA threonylcarbamoyladenosine biosynthesis protein TsaB
MTYADKNILALDSSTRTLKLALKFGGDRLVKSESEADQSHGQIIIKRISDLLGSAGIRQIDIEAMVVSIGPGSFTGLRIGLAAAKGIATALDIPIAAVSSFEIAKSKQSSKAVSLWAVTPLARDHFFVASLDETVFDSSTISVVSINELLEIGKKSKLIGLGCNLNEYLDDKSVVEQPGEIAFNAADLLAIGEIKLNQNVVADLINLEPLYLQKSQAEIRFEQRHKKKS